MEQKDISEYSNEELKVIAFEAYQNREMANNQITKANQTIMQVNQELNKRLETKTGDNQIMEMEPFGTSALQTFGAFGFLVIFMFVVIYKLYMQVQTSKKRNEELSDKTIELVTKVADRIPGLDKIAEMRINQGAMIKNQSDIIDLLQKMIDNLNRK